MLGTLGPAHNKQKNAKETIRYNQIVTSGTQCLTRHDHQPVLKRCSTRDEPETRSSKPMAPKISVRWSRVWNCDGSGVPCSNTPYINYPPPHYLMWACIK